MEDYYSTTDTSFAAYLCCRGYTLLGSVWEGGERMTLVLTHTDQQKRSDMHKDVLVKQDEFNTFRIYVDDTERPTTFKEYHQKYRMCLRELKNPVSSTQLEKNAQNI
jgi:hypothetical protein